MSVFTDFADVCFKAIDAAIDSISKLTISIGSTIQTVHAISDTEKARAIRSKVEDLRVRMVRVNGEKFENVEALKNISNRDVFAKNWSEYKKSCSIISEQLNGLFGETDQEQRVLSQVLMLEDASELRGIIKKQIDMYEILAKFPEPNSSIDLEKTSEIVEKLEGVYHAVVNLERNLDAFMEKVK